MQWELFAAAATSPAHRVPCLRKEWEEQLITGIQNTRVYTSRRAHANEQINTQLLKWKARTLTRKHTFSQINVYNPVDAALNRIVYA